MTPDPRAASLVQAARIRGLRIATAESLTAGLVSAAIASIPGASAVLTGGVVSYATATKHDLLGLPADLLDHVVSPRVAEAMASSVARLLGADVGLATTGVAGPESLDGKPPGTVWIAVALRRGPVVRSQLLTLAGDRADVRSGSVAAVLELATAVITGTDSGFA